MRILPGSFLRRITAMLSGGAACALALAPLPCHADLGPQAAILISADYSWVRLQEDECGGAQATNCHQIIRSTSAEGDVVFVLYYMTGRSWGNLASFRDTLTWPPTWEMMDMVPCGGGSGFLGSDGELSLDWNDYPISPDQEGVVPLALIWLKVHGPGRLGFVRDWGEVMLRSYGRCPVWEVYAEAGMQCGHISAHCGEMYVGCDVDFRLSELVLTAPFGGAADSTIRINPHRVWTCWTLEIDTHAPWCTASLVQGSGDIWYLTVDANAAGLMPGRYDTWVELFHEAWEVSRCLPVGFVVESPTATTPTNWGRVKVLYR